MNRQRRWTLCQMGIYVKQRGSSIRKSRWWSRWLLCTFWCLFEVTVSFPIESIHAHTCLSSGFWKSSKRSQRSWPPTMNRRSSGGRLAALSLVASDVFFAATNVPMKGDLEILCDPHQWSNLYPFLTEGEPTSPLLNDQPAINQNIHIDIPSRILIKNQEPSYSPQHLPHPHATKNQPSFGLWIHLKPARPSKSSSTFISDSYLIIHIHIHIPFISTFTFQSFAGFCQFLSSSLHPSEGLRMKS